MNKAVYRLMAGFRKFREKYYLQYDPELSVYHRLANAGQTPKILLIGCSDSRVDPAILFGSEPGELFVVRNVANLVPPCEHSAGGFHGTSSAIEFAVMNLKVENIIVLGHRQCGGIRAHMQQTKNDQSFVGQWMSIAHEARERVLADATLLDEESRIRKAEMESIRVSIKNLYTFPFVKEATENGTLSVFGAYFDLELGQLWEYHHLTQAFRQLEI